VMCSLIANYQQQLTLTPATTYACVSVSWSSLLLLQWIAFSPTY